jgi:hypothetical protein
MAMERVSERGGESRNQAEGPKMGLDATTFDPCTLIVLHRPRVHECDKIACCGISASVRTNAFSWSALACSSLMTGWF